MTSSNSSGLMFMSVRSRTIPALFTTASMPAERVDAGLDHRFRDSIVRHGAGRGDDPTAVRLDLAREVVQQRLVRAVHDDVGPLGCERERERPTETSRRSRDDDPLAVEHAHGGRA